MAKIAVKIPQDILTELRIELSSLREVLHPKDIEQLAIENYMSTASIYNYLGGKIANIYIAQGIINSANELLANK